VTAPDDARRAAQLAAVRGQLTEWAGKIDDDRLGWLAAHLPEVLVWLVPGPAYCAVLFMSEECTEHPGRRCCVMDVQGPFPNRDAAKDAAGHWPGWATPHVSRVRRDDLGGW
jgi:hypothetical protein